MNNATVAILVALLCLLHLDRASAAAASFDRGRLLGPFDDFYNVLGDDNTDDRVLGDDNTDDSGDKCMGPFRPRN
jgi:hypothetical protein